MLRRMRLITTAGASLALAAGLAAQSAVAPSDPAGLRVVQQDSRPATVIEVERIRSVQGDDNFQQYCAQCHGSDARGTGPMAPGLQVPPADLTLIAVRNGGVFPAAHVRQSIDGDHNRALIGMPKWKTTLRSISVSDHETMIRLANLVRYLESIQGQ